MSSRLFFSVFTFIALLLTVLSLFNEVPKAPWQGRRVGEGEQGRGAEGLGGGQEMSRRERCMLMEAHSVLEPVQTPM